MASNDQKIRQIQNAALGLFSRYGFRKTSMLDIAREAGISRAALYLSFCSKEEVFRSLSIRLHEEVMERVEAAFAQEGAVLARVEQGLLAFMLGLTEPVTHSSHGQELFDANMALAADITGSAQSRLLALLEENLAGAASTGEIDLAASGASAEALAKMIFRAADGIKHAESPVAKDLAEQLSLLMRVLARALIKA